MAKVATSHPLRSIYLGPKALKRPITIGTKAAGHHRLVRASLGQI